jgi:hypothetical protein
MCSECCDARVAAVVVVVAADALEFDSGTVVDGDGQTASRDDAGWTAVIRCTYEMKDVVVGSDAVAVAE